MLKVNKQQTLTPLQDHAFSQTSLPISFRIFESSSSTSSFSNSCGSSSSSCGCFCNWDGCDPFSEHLKSGLLVHIQDCHVTPQLLSPKGHYVCLWKGCKVYGQPSVSQSWLSRHVLYHSEAKGKPFSCIFEKCPLRFSSSSLLERHIGRDHEQSERSVVILDSASQKGIRKNHLATLKNCSSKPLKRRRKLRYYRVRRTDFYDSRSKTIIKNRLMLDQIISACGALNRLNSPMSRRRNIFPTFHGNRDSSIVTRDKTIGYSNFAMPSPMSDSSLQPAPEKRQLRSSGHVLQNLPSGKVDEMNKLANPRKPDGSRVKLLLTVPHTFVGQRLSSENKTEYLVKWQGDLCSGTLPVMWVEADDVRAAAQIDKM